MFHYGLSIYLQSLPLYKVISKEEKDIISLSPPYNIKNTKLYNTCIKKNYISFVCHMLNKNLYVDKIFNIACLLGNYDIVKLLIDKVNKEDRYLINSMKNHHKHITKLLLDKGYVISPDLFHYLVDNGDAKLLQDNIDRGLDINYSFVKAVINNYIDIVKILYPYIRIKDLKEDVYKYGQLDVIHYVWKEGFDIDQQALLEVSFDNNRVIKFLTAVVKIKTTANSYRYDFIKRLSKPEIVKTCKLFYNSLLIRNMSKLL